MAGFVVKEPGYSSQTIEKIISIRCAHSMIAILGQALSASFFLRDSEAGRL